MNQSARYAEQLFSQVVKKVMVVLSDKLTLAQAVPATNTHPFLRVPLCTRTVQSFLKEKNVLSPYKIMLTDRSLKICKDFSYR